MKCHVLDVYPTSADADMVAVLNYNVPVLKQVVQVSIF